MADAKIIIEAISDNTGIKDLSTALGEAQGKLKEMRQKLKDAEKAGNLTEQEMKALRAEFNQQKLVCGQLNSELKRTASALTQTGKDAGGLKEQLKDMISDKLGVDLDSIASKFTTTSSAMLAVGAAAATMAAALVSASRDLSSFSNQFIAFAGNAKQAKIIYDEFNKVYRNTNYDEQKVYDMGKAFMSLGMSAKEASGLVMECADAAAKMGKGVEFADELTNAFKRLYTGGELTERQLKSMAEAGIDLSDVQDQIREGGEEAYEALKEKLKEYAGGMDRAKRTAAEMEGDIKGNLIEIGRQTAELIDDVFGFSEALRGFYQWLIDVTQATIDSIRACMAAFGRAQAAANSYNATMAALGDEYDDLYEAANNGDVAAAARINDIQQEAFQRAELAKQVETERQEKERLQALEAKRPKVRSIAKPTSSGGGGGGGATKDNSAREAEKAAKELARQNAKGFSELQKSQERTISNEKAINALKNQGISISQQMALIGLTGAQRELAESSQKIENIQREALADQKLQEQRLANYEVLKKYLAENPFEGSETILANLDTQKQQEQQLFEQRQANYEAMIELQKKQTADISAIETDSPGSGLSVDQLDGIASAVDKIKAKWTELQLFLGKEASPQLALAFNTIAKPFTTMCQSILDGTKSVGEAMKDFVKQMIMQSLNLLLQWTTIYALIAAFTGNPYKAGKVATAMTLGPGFYRDGGIVKKADGGYISGPGSNRSDSVPAMLSAGEFVLNASAVNAVGADNLARINAAGSAADSVAGIGSNVTLNVSAVDASGFSDFLARGGLQAIKQALVNDDRSFGAAAVW